MVTTATVEANSVTEAVAKVNAIHKAFGNDVEIDLSILADETDDARDAKALGYAFTWLKNKAQEETNMTGAIQFEDFKGLTSMPQKAATAWGAVEGLVGAKYVPLLYVGTQVVTGLNHWFIAQVTSVTAHPKKKIVKLAVNEFQGKFELVDDKTETIFE